MANIQRNFIAGRMNKSLDERLVPNGEYIDALNVRLGSTEGGEVGSVENSKGNTKMTSLQYEQTASTTGAVLLSSQARCIGAYEDGQSNRIYWFVHDPAYTLGETGKIDMVVSFNPTTQSLTYHIISIDDGFGANTTLNFNPQHLITGIDLVDDLLFFTDNINPPRFINVTQNYPNPFYDVDVVTAEEFMVIKKPPIKAPSIVLKSLSNPNEDDFLETRFICFAYRYQYTNGEFSATSQWSEPAFDPGFFNYSFSTNLNEGMVNTVTSVDIQFNSGSSLVKGIELLYKESTDDTIKIIDKLSKNLQGYADNTEYTFVFDNSKIFTILPSTELLRLYDNVPLKALGQTLMGNRLVYGNYIEGYDLKDIFNNPVKLEYTTQLTEGDATNASLPSSTLPSNYTFGSTITVNDSIIKIDFAEINQFTKIISGSSININFTFERSSYYAGAFGGLIPTSQTENITIPFNYLIPQTFDSLYELVESQAFKDAIGTSTNIKPVYAASGETSCSGFTLTDLFNCLIPTTLTTTTALGVTGTVTKFESGIDASGEPIKIVNNIPSSTSLQLQLPAIRFTQDPAIPTVPGSIWEYYKVVSLQSSFGSAGNPTSLHSNRGYEIGIVYMDEFLRSSTALVSPNNTVRIPCGNSSRQNKIQVTIPWAQRAPYWAKYYKFVIKPDKSTYETIYTETFFKDPNSNSVFLLLEGENAAKVESGQNLIVKSDTGGPLNRCITSTVISKEVQAKDFLKIPDPLQPSVTDAFLTVPAGAYMEIKPTGFSLNKIEQIGGSVQNADDTSTRAANAGKNEGYPIATCLISIKNSANTAYVNYSIPAGSRIKISINQVRNEPGILGLGNKNCLTRTNIFTGTYESPTTYPDFETWFNSENIGNFIETQSITSTGSEFGQMYNVYNSIRIDAAGNPKGTIPITNRNNAYIPLSDTTNYYNFYKNLDDDSIWFLATGTRTCRAVGGFNFLGGADSTVSVSIEVIRADQGGVIVFETVPSDASPDIWYENNLNFNVNTNGEHQGTQANQRVQTKNSAIVDTGFFDCFTFGNGVESYTIRDSVKGEAFALGNRVTTTSGQEYKEAHRFADLTYSGVYNDESNVNKLNEFNLGLVNYKTLEDSFGSIQKLHSRKTDILTLQEDKISYVLAGKDLLTDAGGTGSLTSVPEVLGQQISRIEEFGISRNPESFAVFGADKFFTDEQRGAVIQLKGGAYNQESLTVISESGMRGWFRDLFHDNFDAQKIGGFDPYMNEYVLSANSITLPFVGNCDLCGSSRNITIPVGEQVSYCVDVTQEVGTVEIEYVIPSGGNDNIITEADTPNPNAGLVKMITETNSTAASGNEIVIEDSTNNNTYTITALYNGTSTSVTTSVNGILNVAKNSVYAEDMTIVVSSNSITADTIEVTVNCPEPDEITIIQVGVVSNADRGKFIHNEYRWQDGLFNSPPHGNLTPMEFPNGTNNPLVAPFVTLTGGQGAGVIPDDGAKVIIGSNKFGFDNYDFKPDTNNFRFLRTATVYGEFIQADIVALLAASTIVTPIQNNSPEFTATFTMPSGNTEDNLYLIYDYRDSTEVQLCYSNVDLNDVCCVGCNVEPTPTPTPEPPPAPLACNSYTLASPSTCTTYDVLANGGDTIRIDFTDCDGNPDFIASLPAGDGVDVCSTTIPTTTPSTGTVTAGSSCGGSDNIFTWESCNGVQLQETVGGGKSVVKCAQNIPVRTSGTNGTVTAGSACEQYNYSAIQCGSSGTRVFLSGKTSLGLFSVGNFVYYDEINLSGSNVSIRKCAQIEIVNWGDGASGDIVGEASACNDPVNCPSDSTDNPIWMFNQRQNNGADSSSQLEPCNTIYCNNSVFTSITTTNNLFNGDVLFFIDSNFNTPFNGNNKYFGFRAPATGTKKAVAGFMEGWVQIGNNGRVISFSLC
tara:strand:+ start:1993 stop:7713 length:5721 start_codon:yes stop_codon:yes gene_type:complete